MKQLSGFFWIILTIHLLAACDSGSQRSVNREALMEEMQNREPKKLSEAQITAEAFRQGNLIAEAAQVSLLKKLKEVIQEEGIAAAMEYCHIETLPLADSLSKAYHATIRRSSLKLRNPENVPDELEKQLLEAYHYNQENKLPLEENVQRQGQEYLLYSKPISIGSPLCLNCHGTAGKEIADETLQLIDSLYPNDSARGYALGDLRGIWSIRLSRKAVVNSL